MQRNSPGGSTQQASSVTSHLGDTLLLLCYHRKITTSEAQSCLLWCTTVASTAGDPLYWQGVTHLIVPSYAVSRHKE